MILTADYHTHTKYSHGKNNVLENAFSAKEKGLKEIGITDHGFAHPAFGLRQRKLQSLKEDCVTATKETGVKVLVGIESNIQGIDGTVDLKPKNYDNFDIFLAGFHKFVMFKPSMALSVFLPDYLSTVFKKKTVSKSLIKRNTKAFVNVIKNNPIDIITHLNYFCFADAVEVAKVAADYGTYIELNAKKTHLSDEELFNIVKTGVNFVIDSDAHTRERVGEISLILETLKRVDIPEDRIKNINGRLPDFRFRRFKEGK